jgi:hypothetical protein
MLRWADVRRTPIPLSRHYPRYRGGSLEHLYNYQSLHPLTPSLFYSGENLSEEECKQTEEKSDPLEDAKKAQIYLDRLIQMLN